MRKRNFFDDYAEVNKEAIEKLTQAQPNNTVMVADTAPAAELVKVHEPEQIPAPAVEMVAAKTVESEVNNNETEAE